MTSNPKKKRNVLVLEDEAFIAMILQDELEALGIHVIGPVNNLKSAITIAETSELDGALLDLNINGTYGSPSLSYSLELNSMPNSSIRRVRSNSVKAGREYDLPSRRPQAIAEFRKSEIRWPRSLI